MINSIQTQATKLVANQSYDEVENLIATLQYANENRDRDTGLAEKLLQTRGIRTINIKNIDKDLINDKGDYEFIYEHTLVDSSKVYIIPLRLPDLETAKQICIALSSHY